MADYYILNDEKKPVRVSFQTYMHYNVARLQKGGDGFERVALDKTPHFELSTIFLGLDHSMRDFNFEPDIDTQPVLFETMLFARSDLLASIDQEMIRYHTWEQAVTGHKMILERLNAVLAQTPLLEGGELAFRQFISTLPPSQE